MAWTERDIPDLSGRTAVVTGANGGLGLQTALALAGAGAHVVMAARDPEKTAAAEARIRLTHPAASLQVVPLDLGDLSSVAAAAREVLDRHARVDLLVDNAGVMAMPQRTTSDGFEVQLGVNHLGHWALTAHLLPALLRAPAARVVTVTSTARHRARRLDPADVHLERGYRPWAAYARSKMANLHFGLGLQQRFAAAGVAARSLLAHPGLSNTDLQARAVREGGAGRLGPVFELMTARSGMSPFEGLDRSCGPRPTRGPVAGSCTHRGTAPTARPCGGRSCAGSTCRSRSTSCGRSPSARPESHWTSSPVEGGGQRAPAEITAR